MARILNYNKQNHDIYLFDESQMVLLSQLPPSINEFQAYPCPTSSPRRHAPVLGYNFNGIWNRAADYGLQVPDWSGLHTRGRGSCLNTCQSPNQTFYNSTVYLKDPPPYSAVLDTNNWNSGSPPAYVISPKHFLGCAHFYSQPTMTITLLGKNNQIYIKTGELVGIYSDTTLYRFTPPLTAEEQIQIKAYDIPDPRTVPVGTACWRQTPNGSFALLKTKGNFNSSSGLPFEDAGASNGFPNVDPLGASWSGDSGSPVLATLNNETYLLRTLAGSFGYATDDFWQWLYPLLQADGITKNRVNLGYDYLGALQGASAKFPKYRSGFLEESGASGLPFSSLTLPGGNPPLVSARVCGEFNGYEASLSDVEIANSRFYTPAPRLSCNLLVDGVVVLSKEQMQQARNGAYIQAMGAYSQGNMAHTWSNFGTVAGVNQALGAASAPGGFIDYSSGFAILSTRPNSPNSRAELRHTGNRQSGLSPGVVNGGLSSGPSSVRFFGRLASQSPIELAPAQRTMCNIGFYRGHIPFSATQGETTRHGFEAACCFFADGGLLWKCLVGYTAVQADNSKTFEVSHEFTTDVPVAEEHELLVEADPDADIALFYVDGELVYKAVGGLPARENDVDGVWAGCLVRDVSRAAPITQPQNVPSGGSPVPAQLICKSLVFKAGKPAVDSVNPEGVVPRRNMVFHGYNKGSFSETWSFGNGTPQPDLNPGGSITYDSVSSYGLLSTQADSPNSRAEIRSGGDYSNAAPIQLIGGSALYLNCEARVVQQSLFDAVPSQRTIAVVGFFNLDDAFQAETSVIDNLYGIRAICAFVSINGTWRVLVGYREVQPDSSVIFRKTHEYNTLVRSTVPVPANLSVFISADGSKADFYIGTVLQYTATGGLPTSNVTSEGLWAGCAVRDVSLAEGIQSGSFGTPTGGSPVPCQLRCNFMTFDTEVQLPVLSATDVYFDEKQLDGYVHGVIGSPSSKAFFSYVMPLESEFTSPNSSLIYSLAPVCIEAHVGWLDVSVEGQSLPVKPLHLLPGYNYQMDYSSENPVSATFSVVPGAGDGQQPCQEEPVADIAVRRINGQEANSRGDFGIQPLSAECITVDSRYIDNKGTIKVDAHCAPCCRCKDYSDSSVYIKSLAIDYNNAVRRLDELIGIYNSVVRAFSVRSGCCPTFGALTPRFRMWPQQNFKLQVQAMVENNTSGRIRMNSLKLITEITAKNSMTAVDENGQTYTISAGQSVAAIPLADASYLYFKNLNPTSRNMQFSIVNQGVIETSVDLVSLPLPSCGSAGDHPNDVEPCTGYAMITTGVVVVDPVFRKIVNLNGADAQLDIRVRYSYFGSQAGGDSCGPVSDRQITPTTGTIKSVKMSPNKKSVNPCPSATGSFISVNADKTISLRMSDMVSGSGTVTLSFKQLIEGQWVEVSTSSASVSSSGQSSVSLGSVPSSLTGTMQVSATYSSGGGLVTKCKAVDASDDEVDIPVGSFTVATSFTA